MIIIQGVDYMFLRKLGKRGVAMTEYAVLLAFVAAIGGSFASDNGLGQSIMNAITGAKNAIMILTVSYGRLLLSITKIWKRITDQFLR